MATVALSSLVVGVAAVPGGAAAASTAAVTAPAVDPDTLTVAQAVAQARKSGEPVVVTGSTTSTSELVARPDGGMSLSLNAQPVRKRIGTKWSRLDATLRPNADGSVSPAVTTAPVRLSGGGNGPFATMDGGAAGLSLSLPMTLPAPVLSGDTATYAEILPGVDLRVRVTDQGGVSEVLVVKDARAAHDPRLRELRMATRATGMTLRVDADGGLSGRDGFGQTLLRAQPPKMWDSTPVGDVPQVKGRIADGRPARSSAVAPGAAATVGRIGLAVGPDAITLTPDLALLTGAKTTYPVFIDPTPVWTPKSYNKTGWASVAQPYPSSSYWNDTPDPDGHMQVGNSGSMWSHTLINFALPTLAAGSTVHKATLRSREVWSWSCTASTVNVYAPTAYTLSSSNATWNYWNGKQGSVVDGQPEAHGYSSSCPAADVEFDVLSTVAARLGNTQTFLLMGSNEANDHNSWKEFDPNLTTLNLEYNQPPSTPTSLSTSPLTTCTGLTTIGDADVSLRAVVADPDGGSVGAGFELWKSSAPGTILYSTNPANFDFGSGSTAVAIVGKAVLENAAAGAVTTFSWRVRTYDGFSYSPAYSTTCQFKFDPTRAGPPGVTVAGGATVGASVQVTITPPVTGTAPTSYMYQLNAGTPVPVAAGQLTFAIVPTRFTNTITVTGLSAGGNVGDSASLTFTAQAGAPEAVDDLTMDGRADLLSTGRASNGLPGGLWLAKATSGNRLDQVAHDIGINGTGVFGTSSPHEYDAAASTATGTFTGGTQNDVLAYYPADTTLQRSGMAVILKGNGDDSTLQTASGFTNTVSPGTFTDLHGQDPIRVANAYNARGAGLAYPDLIAVNGSTDYGHFYLSYYPNSNMVGGYAMGYDIAVNTPDGDQNWQNWDITTTRLPTGTAMYLRNTVTGALRLWTGITVTTNDATFTATIAYTTHTVTVTGLGATATVQAADIDGNGTADLWSTSGGVTTPRLVTAISDPAGTATLTAQATIPLVTAAHAWTLADMGSAVAGAPITTAADVVGSLNLAAAGGATWNTGDLFSPDAQLNGVSGTLVTTGPAVATNADFSVSLWAKPTGGGTVLSQDGNNAAGFKLWAEPSDKSWRFAMSQSDVASPVWDTAIAPPGSASYGVWSQITVTYKAATNTVVLYLNGVDVATTGHSVKWNATGALRVGAHRSGAGAVGGWFGGQVAQVQTWHTEIIASGTLSFAYNWYDDGPGWNTWNSITVVDVDNDGKADVAGRYNDHLWFKLSTSSSSAVSFGGWLDFGGGWNTWDNIGFADVTGDGKPELLGRYNDHLWYKVNTSTATAISFGSAWYDDGAGWNAATVIKVVDVNADGRADVMRRYNDHIWFKLSTSTGGTVSFGGWQDLGGGWNTWDNVQAADVTGDGKPELIGRYNNHMWYKINTTVGSSVSFADDWFDDGVGWNTWDWITVVDVNHDGKADVVGRTVDHLWIKLSTSSASTIGFSNVWEDLGTGWNARDYVQAADVTGDGRPELVSRYGDHMWYKINTSTI